MRLKIGDVVMQISNESIWIIEEERGNVFNARCVYGGEQTTWNIGATCPFNVEYPSNDVGDHGVVYLGTDPNIDIDTARAIAALTGAFS